MRCRKRRKKHHHVRPEGELSPPYFPSECPSRDEQEYDEHGPGAATPVQKGSCATNSTAKKWQSNKSVQWVALLNQGLQWALHMGSILLYFIFRPPEVTFIEM